MKRLSYLAPTLCVLAVLAIPGGASDPPSHDVTAPTRIGDSVVVEWVGTVQPGAVAGGTNSCDNGVTPLEDHHAINLTVPPGLYGSVSVTAAFHIEWDTAGSDLVLTVMKDGTTVASSDGGTPEENVVMTNPNSGAFDAIACAFAATEPTPYRGRLTLTATPAPFSPPAGTGNATGLPPRFQNYAPDYPEQGFGMFGGEATVDVNTQTGSLFYLGFLETLRLKLDDTTSPARQTWELMDTVASSVATSDPIVVSDRDTGRVFTMQLLIGEGQSAMDISDDDGETWTPAMAGGIRSGADHQSMAVGPYPAGSAIPHPLYPNAIYYCSQDVALVFCSRSDDGGLTFGAGVPIYTLLDCQGLHGHVKIAPDGTVYVPVSGCPSPLVDSASSQPAVVVSTDAGLTWTIRPISTAPAGSGGHGADPSIGIASDGTMYFSYVDARDGHLRVAVSRDRGETWLRDIDVGGLGGITFAQFPAAVAGDPDRAAVAFFGTTYNGEGVDTAENFNGTWWMFVATTYDAGQTWHIVDASQGDPVQKGGICSGGFCRNLLDFFDAVIDTEGRIVVSYEDGCVGGCPLGSHGTFSDQAVLARQSGGRRLLAAFDPVEPARPGAPGIDGYRRENFALIEWPEPDASASTITEYKVYRGTSEGALSFYKSTGTKRALVDTGLDAGTTYYYAVSAVNGQGESARGNTLALAVGDNAVDLLAACTLPGLQLATDRTGEPEGQPANRDISALYVAEPEDMPGKIAFRITNVAPSPEGSSAIWHVYFDMPNGGKRYQLELSAIGAEYGTLGIDPETGVHNFYTTEGDLDAGSGIDPATGDVTMVLDKATLGLRTGDTLHQVYADSWPSLVSANITVDEAGYRDYKLVGNDFCANGGVVSPPDIGGGTGGTTGTTVGGATGPVDDNRFGGALALTLLLPLAGFWLSRRRG